MKRLRHRLGRWLLRDQTTTISISVVPDCRGWSEQLRDRLRGGGDLA